MQADNRSISESNMRMRFIIPLFVATFAVFSEYSGLDIALARNFYNDTTGTWPLKNDFLVAGVLHTFARDCVVYVMVGVLLLLVSSFVFKRFRPFRKGAAYMLLGSLAGVALVAILKDSTHIYTPWDLVLFGGDKPHVRIFDPSPAGLPVGHAFPGGHSSGGFAFFSVYFLLSRYRPKYRHFGLALGLTVGGIFAAAQEMKGAHFLSHDLFSLVICWYSAFAVYKLMFHKELEAIQRQQELSRPLSAQEGDPVRDCGD